MFGEVCPWKYANPKRKWIIFQPSIFLRCELAVRFREGRASPKEIFSLKFRCHVYQKSKAMRWQEKTSQDEFANEKPSSCTHLMVSQIEIEDANPRKIAGFSKYLWRNWSESCRSGKFSKPRGGLKDQLQKIPCLFEEKDLEGIFKCRVIPGPGFQDSQNLHSLYPNFCTEIPGPGHQKYVEMFKRNLLFQTLIFEIKFLGCIAKSKAVVMAVLFS